MTLSVIKYTKDDKRPDQDYLFCGADARISGTQKENASVDIYTNAAIKILPLQLKLSPLDYAEYKIWPLSYDIGFTYAGHVGVSLYTYALLSYLCKDLHFTTPEIKDSMPFPSIESIAVLARNILLDYIKDYGSILTMEAFAQIVLFGFCPQKHDFVVYNIEPKISKYEGVDVTITNIDIKNIPYFAIGSGKKGFAQNITQNGGELKPGMIRKFIENQECNSSVGGYYQRAVYSRNGLTLYSESPSSDIEMKMLGRFGPVYSLGTHYISLTSTLRCDYE